MPSKKNKNRSSSKSKKKTRPRAKVKVTKKSAKKKAPKKKVASRAKASTRKKAASVNAEAELKRAFQSRNRGDAGMATAKRSTDFEGLSRAEEADSESVDELAEEGNIFEAGAVAGVEEADNADETEVHTHEVPEDDVPEEYLDKD